MEKEITLLTNQDSIAQDNQYTWKVILERTFIITQNGVLKTPQTNHILVGNNLTIKVQ